MHETNHQTEVFQVEVRSAGKRWQSASLLPTLTYRHHKKEMPPPATRRTSLSASAWCNASLGRENPMDSVSVLVDRGAKLYGITLLRPRRRGLPSVSLTHLGSKCIPVSRAQGWVLQVLNQGHRLPELLDPLLHGLPHFPLLHVSA